MNFKDRLLMDLDTVFLNSGVFGEEVEFLGNQCMAVVEHGGAEFLSESDDRAGVALETVTLRLKREEAPVVLTPGLAVTFEGQRWHVHSAVPEMGLLTVNLYREVAA